MSAYRAAASTSSLFWALDDEDYEEIQEVGEPKDWELRQSPEVWGRHFKYYLYDWDDPEFVRKNVGPNAYRVTLLTQGYFMIVSPHDYERMTQFPDGSQKRWHVCVKKSPETGECVGIYARRKGRGDEPKSVYAHRELIGCLSDNGVVDHKNGWGLDNRRGTQQHPINLHFTDQSENMHNTQRVRRSNPDLPRGVERRGKSKRGEQLFGGMYCKRSGTKVKTFRSRRKWRDPQRAAQWYQNSMMRLHKRRAGWAHNPTSVSFPEFPPESSADDIPF